MVMNCLAKRRGRNTGRYYLKGSWCRQGYFRETENHIAGESDRRNYCGGREVIPSLLGRKTMEAVSFGQLAVFAVAAGMIV